MGLADIGTERVRAQHYGGESYDRSGGAVVGTFFGHHSITEVRDLAATVDFRVRATDALIAKHGLSLPLPAVRNWLDFKDRWQQVSRPVLLSLAAQASSSRVISADRYPAEAEYQQIRCAINRSCDDTHADPGDLFNVIAAVEAACQERIDERSHPAPTPNDPDLLAFQRLDAAIHAGESAVGVPPKDKPWWSIPWWGYALGVVFVGGVGYSFYRTYKRAKATAEWGEKYLGGTVIPKLLPGIEPMPTFHRDPATGVMIPVAVPQGSQTVQAYASPSIPPFTPPLP